VSIDVDRGALAKITSALAAAGTDFDDTGKSAPASADAGVATGVLADILFTFGDSGSRLVGDAAALSQTAEACNVNYETADSAAAERFLSTGVPVP
jgi:hypothetical protein